MSNQAPALSLADHQLTKDRLRLEIVAEELRGLSRATCDTRAATAAGIATRAAVHQALAALEGRWLTAIAGEHDETRVHYLLADTLHSVLQELAARLPTAATALPLIGERLARGMRPRPLLSVSQWADRHRVLETGTNSPGPWRTALTPYLKAIQDDLSEHSPTRTVVFMKSAGVGGPLALDTPIPTPAGWATMGDLRPGDQVIADTGQSCTVTYASPVFIGRACYAITFSDGAVITCDDEHRWTVIDRFPGHRGKRRGQHRHSVTLTTAELVAGYRVRGRWRYAIPLPGALDLPAADLPIPPYVFGYWLANGQASGNQMTCHDDDALEMAELLTAAGMPAIARKLAGAKGQASNLLLVRERLPAGTCRRGHDLALVGTFIDSAGHVCCSECRRQHAMHHQYGKARDPVLVAPGFLTLISRLGADAKDHIPAVYLRASGAQRLALLQGLMDGDGHAGTNGRCEYSTVSPALARDMLELLHSLNLKPSHYLAPRRGFAGAAPRQPGDHHRISFVAYADQPVFRLARKRARQPNATAGRPLMVKRREIVAIDPVPSVPVRCIAVDAPSHLYLCGRAMIPTHNTEALFNWAGYVMAHLQNKDLLLVVPTLELRDRSFNPRLAKMIDETPALSALVSTAQRARVNRGDLLEYGARARLIKAGANSPDSLRADHLPYVILDEVDAFPWDVGGEGDPLTLIENRQRTFTRAKTYMVSTPTTQGLSRIEMMYQRSDQRRYELPCPHCGHFQPLEWPHLYYRKAPPPADDPHPVPQVLEAWYACVSCGAEIGEGQKPAMLAAGEWRAQRPSVKHIHGYHLNALYAPLGLGLTWRQIAQKWESCQGDSAELKSFVNTYLGQTWQERGDHIEDIALIARLEPYERADLPLAIVTAGVDVQKNRLEISLVGWGAGEEAWLLDHVVLEGDTALPAVWLDLEALLRDQEVGFTAIDSGFQTSMVYDFVRPRHYCRAIKGDEGMHRPLVAEERKRRQWLRRRNRTGVQPEPLGVDQGKALLYARLKLPRHGPGYIHFPRTASFDDEYFSQLAAERLITEYRAGRPKVYWKKTRPRNEALDCLLYALAALRLSNVDLTQAQARRRGEASDPASAPRWRRFDVL